MAGVLCLRVWLCNLMLIFKSLFSFYLCNRALNWGWSSMKEQIMSDCSSRSFFFLSSHSAKVWGSLMSFITVVMNKSSAKVFFMGSSSWVVTNKNTAGSEKNSKTFSFEHMIEIKWNGFDLNIKNYFCWRFWRNSESKLKPIPPRGSLNISEFSNQSVCLFNCNCITFCVTFCLFVFVFVFVVCVFDFSEIIATFSDVCKFCMQSEHFLWMQSKMHAQLHHTLFSIGQVGTFVCQKVVSSQKRRKLFIFVQTPKRCFSFYLHEIVC